MKKSTDDRHKTDLRIPRDLYERIEVIAKETLGIPVNSFFAMAASHYAGVVTQNQPGRKRRDLLKALEREFQRIVEKALETA